MIKKILLVSTALLMLTGCNNEEISKEQIKLNQTVNVSTLENNVSEDEFFENYTTEFFRITSVENGIIRGELTSGTGEGIYYDLIEDKEELKQHEALWDLEKGDIISVSWTIENYNNDEWLDIYKVVFVKSNEELSKLEGVEL